MADLARPGLRAMQLSDYSMLKCCADFSSQLDQSCEPRFFVAKC